MEETILKAQREAESELNSLGKFTRLKPLFRNTYFWKKHVFLYTGVYLIGSNKFYFDTNLARQLFSVRSENPKDMDTNTELDIEADPVEDTIEDDYPFANLLDAIRNGTYVQGLTDTIRSNSE